MSGFCTRHRPGVSVPIVAVVMAAEFAVVYWRSLRNAPPVEEWLAGALAALSAQQAVPSEGLEARPGPPTSWSR